jgi:hypothetical protein
MPDDRTVRMLQETCPRSLLLEHVMRRTDDESLLLAFVDVEPLSEAFLVALGRLLAASPGPIKAGTPLQVWAGSGTLQRRWRDVCAPVPVSIWGELVTLRALFGDAATEQSPGLDPLGELQEFRSRL